MSGDNLSPLIKNESSVTVADMNMRVFALVAALTAIRSQIPALTQDQWWTGEGDVQWRDTFGQALTAQDWGSATTRDLAVRWAQGAVQMAPAQGLVVVESRGVNSP